MPITKSAKKAMRQQYTRTERNKATKTMMKTFMKKILDLSKNDPENAAKVLPKAFKVIDMAAKKNIIHPNNADRKKSRLARAVSAGVEKGVSAKSAPVDKQTPAKKSVTSEKTTA